MFSSGVQWIFTSLVMLNLGVAHATTNTTWSVRSCEDARLKCAYRGGCGTALTDYLTFCASDLHEDINSCPESCQHALIALASTDEGKELMTCECNKGDTMCKKSKQRAEICRSSVVAAMNRTRVSCRIASSICNADVLCSTALYYYNENCKGMFNGIKCSRRCRNSIAILSRQEKAAKLNTCICDGYEDYNCKSIHRNMNALCFGKKHPDPHDIQFKNPVIEVPSNEISITGKKMYSRGNPTSICRTELLLGLVLILFLCQKTD